MKPALADVWGVVATVRGRDRTAVEVVTAALHRIAEPFDRWPTLAG